VAHCELAPQCARNLDRPDDFHLTFRCAAHYGLGCPDFIKHTPSTKDEKTKED
jgi:hypothetical protein